MLSNESVNMYHTIHCWSEDAEESNNNMKKDLWIILLRRTSWIIPSGMSQSSGVDFPGSPKQLHLMDLHSRGWLTTSNTRLKVFFFSWVNVAIYSFCFNIHSSAFMLQLWENSMAILSDIAVMLQHSFPLTLALRQWRIGTIGYGRCSCSTTENAESYPFSHSPQVTNSSNIKHHISILHCYDGYS